MKIIFDLYYAQPIGNSKFHGGGEYIKIIFKYIVENYTNIDIYTFFDVEKFIDDWIINLINKYNINVYDVKSQEDINFLLKKNIFDIFYTGMPYLYDNVDLSKINKRVATIHGFRDMELTYDKYCFLYLQIAQKIKIIGRKFLSIIYITRLSKKFGCIVNKFDYIITDSEHSKYAFPIWLNNIGKKDIKVFYAPNKYVRNINNENNNKIDKYFLLIGANRWEKNVYRAILAFELLFSKNLLCEYKVVIVGNLPLKIRNKIKYKDNYVFKGYVDTEELESLYQNCEAFIYPTLNEGFGMPPLEAMKYGKTCIVSCVCSLQEICGDAVYYINPYDIKEIANRILRASEKKIDATNILKQYNKVSRKQKEDLKKLCNYIIEG